MNPNGICIFLQTLHFSSFKHVDIVPTIMHYQMFIMSISFMCTDVIAIDSYKLFLYSILTLGMQIYHITSNCQLFDEYTLICVPAYYWYCHIIPFYLQRQACCKQVILISVVVGFIRNEPLPMNN